MPDISMCPSQDCPMRGGCYRNEASGTQPCEWRQSWSAWTWRQPGGIGAPVECDGSWPREGWVNYFAPASSTPSPTNGE